ncbi:putative transposase, partial [Neisseria meningitidis 61103]
TDKLKKKVQKELLRFFVLEVTARSAADILGIHPNSAALFYRKIRTVINHHLALAADEVFEGSVEPDESDFGGRRKGRRGRGAAGKVVVFGILKRNGRVYTVVVNMPSLKRYSLSSKRKSCRTALFIPIV